MVLRNLRDQELMDIETNDKGPCHEECFLRRWSNVEYNRHVVARQNTFDRIFEGADLLITNATPSGTAESERDEKAAWEQTQVLMQRVVDLADELDKADFPVPGTKQKQGLGAGHRLVSHEHARCDGRSGTCCEQMDPPLPVASKRGDQQPKGHASTGKAAYDAKGVNTMAGRGARELR
jgi:hypothetical protein